MTRASRRILFANVPADGHFNPLTGLAVFLREQGYDVRWYSSALYADKIRRLEIPYYPFNKAMELNNDTVESHFPERKLIKGKISKLNFDIQHFFIRRGEEYYADIKDIYSEFPFDLLIADCLFTGIPFVKDKMKIPVLSIGIMPLAETSKDLAPSGLAMHPATGLAGRTKQAMLRWFADRVLFRKSNELMHQIFDEHFIPHQKENVFDMMVRKSTLLLQSGTPSFEYKRSDLGENVRFIGPLLPYNKKQTQKTWFDPRLNTYERVVLVTQGTVEKDVNKLLVPTLNAFRKSNFLVVVTTGGSDTDKLRNEFPDSNFIIEDFIPFNDIMPYTDVYITNGGYGGVMLGIDHQLPMVVAGVHEGKNEINARIGYFKLGIDLKTENPRPQQIRSAVEMILVNDTYRRRVEELASEFKTYDPLRLTAGFVSEILLTNSGKKKVLADPLIY